MGKGGRQNSHLFQRMALTSLVLSYLVGPLLVGIFGGRWLDEVTGLSPLFLLIGVVGGVAAGVFGLFQVLSHYLGDDEDR
ncbi:putative F0F1-ATPase subunit (Ca2+/Mg2+ transporter) [Salsuginibacillus halophilus]|uniref:Putative F0F1-ATPase subunit (Ca2+/Mg2+ transporter) n=1 Tax=Salsuginibacillus halophilus TaxID=517424 RepID=A0A2P8HHU0_9BACI|nr:AtpZ/AtpI family protein [Salsuginibacillus halophilus]PSL45783.1 putative F0F1-ATPase subunit (Ca2+/Mg2+ transporter) [Salsuginibacillus halophilus]